MAHFYNVAFDRIEAIRNLPIDRLNERLPMLVSVLADCVSYETEEGSLTELNDALEHQCWWRVLNSLLEKDLGFKLLGNGHFSAAYSHPLLPKRVIKVGFKKEDSGAAYVAFCRMHQGRKGIPNIYDVQRHAGCYTVVLDHLNPCDDWNNDTHDHYSELAKDIIVRDEPADCGDEFEETCQMIKEFFSGIASFDMHTGNIMFDDHDNPYITDPVSFSHDKERTEPFSLDPEILLQEIEDMAAKRVIDKAIERKARHEGRLEARQARRKNRKSRKAWLAKCKLDRKIGQIRRKQHVRNMEACKMMIGTDARRDIWWQHGCDEVLAIEEQHAARKFNHDLQAMLHNNDLMIDKIIDNMFNG